MLGRVGLADDADAFIRAEELGPDALDPAFDLAAFEEAIEGRRRDVKSVLMDQALIAGVGNIYADEILFQARLHPHTPVTSLDERQRAELFRQVKQVLEKAIACGAGAEQSLERLPDDYLLPHRDKARQMPALRRSDRDPQGGRADQLLLSALPARPGLIRPRRGSAPSRAACRTGGPCAPLRGPCRRRGPIGRGAPQSRLNSARRRG